MMPRKILAPKELAIAAALAVGFVVAMRLLSFVACVMTGVVS